MALTKITGKGIDDIDVSVAGELEVSSATSDATDKRAFFVTKHYTNSEEDAAGVILQSADGDNLVDIGGGQSAYNAVTKVRFYTAANATTTTGTERMRINSSGNLLVGTATPNDTERLTVLTTTDVAISTRVSSASNFYSLLIRNASNGNTIGSIFSTTTSTSFNTSSDYRLKENVTATWDATTRLKQLKPVRFNFIADADTTVDGFLAHEVQTVVPEAIIGTKDEVDADDNPVYQGIDQSKLVPLLVKTIQELEARITALETA